MDASELLSGYRIVPVVAIDDRAHAVPLAETLVDAGLSVIEITLRTTGALGAIEDVARRVPEILVGAGSIRQAGQVTDVANAGARFGVSPGTTDALLDAVADCGLPFVPGAATPSEMIALCERGYTLQKFFPAEAAGGIALLKSVASPIPEARFVPTGGISYETAPDYLALGNVTAIGGSWITPARIIAAGDFERIGALARDAALLGV